MEEMPADSKIIQIVKLLFCLNIVFSYPVTVYPTNQVIQSTFFINYDEGSFSRNLLNSIASTIVLALGLLFAI